MKQHIEFFRLQAMIEGGAWITIYKTGDRLPLGAATWIDGRGLLFAELGAQHQGHVHLVAAEKLEEDAGSLDVVAAAGDLVATIDPMTIEEYRQAGVAPWQELVTSERDEGMAWTRFWAAEIEARKEG